MCTCRSQLWAFSLALTQEAFDNFCPSVPRMQFAIFYSLLLLPFLLLLLLLLLLFSRLLTLTSTRTWPRPTQKSLSPLDHLSVVPPFRAGAQKSNTAKSRGRGGRRRTRTTTGGRGRRNSKVAPCASPPRFVLKGTDTQREREKESEQTVGGPAAVVSLAPSR